MFNELHEITRKPDVFSTYTAETLWTEPHLAEQMLQTHLDQDSPLASRPTAAIDRAVAWLDKTFRLDQKAVFDLGCGPGLYTERYARLGASVQGLDFSTNSIDYAKKKAAERGIEVTYRVANYLTDPLPAEQDLVTLIYYDLCPLSPSQRTLLLGKIRECLKPGGAFVFDVMSTTSFENFAEHTTFAPNYMDGFWSPDNYFVFHQAHRYENERVSLDHYTVVEQHRTWHVYNWMQYFSPESITTELAANGFSVVDVVNGFHAEERDEASFGVIAER